MIKRTRVVEIVEESTLFGVVYDDYISLLGLYTLDEAGSKCSVSSNAAYCPISRCICKPRSRIAAASCIPIMLPQNGVSEAEK